MAKANLTQSSLKELVLYLEFKKYSESGIREVLSELFRRKTGKVYPTSLGMKDETRSELLAQLVPYGLDKKFAMEKTKNRGLFGDLITAFVSAGKSVIKVGNFIYEAASFVVLAPFKGAMKKALDKKGVKYSNSMKDISEKFVSNVVQNKHYEQLLSNLEHFEALDRLKTLQSYGDLSRLPCFEQDQTAARFSQWSDHAEHLAMAIPAIIGAVMDFFAALKAKKESGAPMSKTENDILQAAEAGAAQADELIKKEQAAAVGKFVIDKWLIGVILAAIVLGFLFFGRRGGWRKA